MVKDKRYVSRKQLKRVLLERLKGEKVVNVYECLKNIIKETEKAYDVEILVKFDNGVVPNITLSEIALNENNIVEFTRQILNE